MLLPISAGTFAKDVPGGKTEITSTHTLLYENGYIVSGLHVTPNIANPSGSMTDSTA